MNKIEKIYDTVAKEYAATFFMPDVITGSLATNGFEKIETIEREPYPDVEYPSWRAYVFASKPPIQTSR